MVRNPTNRQHIRNPTFVGLSDLLQTLYSSGGKTHKAFSESVAFEDGPIQRLLNGQIVAPRRDASTHCKGLLCCIQRMLARIRHILAGVRRRGVSNDTATVTIHINKCLM